MDLETTLAGNAEGQEPFLTLLKRVQWQGYGALQIRYYLISGNHKKSVNVRKALINLESLIFATKCIGSFNLLYEQLLLRIQTILLTMDYIMTASA